MWFYVLAATPYVIIASGVLLAAIITTVILSQTKAPIEARGFYPRLVPVEAAQRSRHPRTTPRHVPRNQSLRLASARFGAMS